MMRSMTPRAELSSLNATLEELTRRVTRLAEEARTSDEELARELFGVERSLTAALRRMTRLAAARPRR